MHALAAPRLRVASFLPVMSSSTQRASYSVAWAGAPLGEPTAEWDATAFAPAQTLEIENFTWREPGPERDHPDFPHPRVQAKVVWDEFYLAVMFHVEDHFVQCKGCVRRTAWHQTPRSR